ncbi:hypothetical protein [Cuniculiplasma divulgatum]|jgi:hypothetical protein|uniref:Multipass membrane protein n=1 Tax=Cuniculiplasma divulgatum TaxID=1673428 RepID=A0A1N5WLD2_9ARCH|nr:hypothetical protein [Cuniculiplasma divulgatum]OWP55734.1 MAG: hypothetical protein B2I18_00925 [Cuniculiplasma sp. C_DKE]WMT50006.1 MAG: hypothetical protein RE472_03310 [Thermoplasmatales archaeon]SIM85918.1 multipass membrane protein [Cuniculiplasma divulgatum]SJK85600.1 multipass membrane protein [Cuniculiplasma divulgatum]
MHDLLYIILTEILMTPFIVFVVLFVSSKFSSMTVRSISLILFLLSMMSGMLNSLNYYLLYPHGFLNQVMAINISMFEMTIIISYILVSAFNGNIGKMTKTHAKWIGILVGWNEVSMALFLYSLAYGFGTNGELVNTINIIGAGITNYLFTIPMIIEMVSLLFLKIHNGLTLRISTGIIAMQASDPGLFSGLYSIPLIIVFSTVMIVVLYFVLSYTYKNRKNLENEWRKMLNYFIFLILLSSIGLVMSAIIPGPFGVKWIIFALSMAFSMVYYFLISFKFFDSSTPVAIRRKLLESESTD